MSDHARVIQVLMDALKPFADQYPVSAVPNDNRLVALSFNASRFREASEAMAAGRTFLEANPCTN